MIRKLIALSLLHSSLVFAGLPANVGIIQLGLTGDDFVGAPGAQTSSVTGLNSQGHVIGENLRWVGESNTANGYSAWFYDGARTEHIGLTGDWFRRTADNYQYSRAQHISDTGQAAGYSRRYSGSSSRGQSTWLYDGIDTIQIGLYGDTYTSGSGQQYSYIHAMNAGGDVAGISRTYAGGNWDHAWLYDGTTNHRVGFYDVDHTGASGQQRSRLFGLSDQGVAIGTSDRYLDGIRRGTSAWLSDGINTRRLGLTDSDHTDASNGNQVSFAYAINDQGVVAGVSVRYITSGSTAWLDDDGTVHTIGLTDSDHTNPLNGAQNSSIDLLNNQGLAAGTSKLYTGKDSSNNYGDSVWLADENGTTRIGLVDPAHTMDSGYQKNEVVGLNEQGQAIGHALRFDGATYLGESAWIGDKSSTTRLGLTGAAYTNESGQQFSSVLDINERGQVAGGSRSYNWSGGGTAWLYDSELDETFSFILSEDSHGNSSSTIRYLGEDGVVLGSYNYYDENDNFWGQRGFYFSIEEGLFDLTDLLLNYGIDIGEEGWVNLGVQFANGSLDIAGVGNLSVGGSSGFLLTAAPVPIPAAAWLFGSALGLLGYAGRRRAR